MTALLHAFLMERDEELVKLDREAIPHGFISRSEGSTLGIEVRLPTRAS